MNVWIAWLIGVFNGPPGDLLFHTLAVIENKTEFFSSSCSNQTIHLAGPPVLSYLGLSSALACHLIILRLLRMIWLKQLLSLWR